MWPTHTPTDRDGTTWQGHMRVRVRVRWGNIAEVGVVREVSIMNFEFIEGGETRDKVVKFGWVGITDEEVVNNKEKRGGVSVMAEEHGGGGFGVAVLGKEGDKAELG